jgi:hypothetical protein
MARGNDPGKDFDDQWKSSRRRGQEKAARGESHWADDAYLRRNNERLGSGPAHHGGGSKSCADKTVLLLATLSGIAWALSEVVSRVA